MGIITMQNLVAQIDILLEQASTLTGDAYFAFNAVLNNGELSGQWFDWSFNSAEHDAMVLAMDLRGLQDKLNQL